MSLPNNLSSSVKSKKNSKKKKNMSKKQKLLRKRFESLKDEKARHEEDDYEEDEKQDVKVKYSVVYFNWAVSDDEDEDDQVTNVTLPLRKLCLKKSH